MMSSSCAASQIRSSPSWGLPNGSRDSNNSAEQQHERWSVAQACACQPCVQDYYR